MTREAGGALHRAPASAGNAQPEGYASVASIWRLIAGTVSADREPAGSCPPAAETQPS